MALWCGKLGFSESVDIGRGNYQEHITELARRGEYSRDRVTFRGGEGSNPDIGFVTTISIFNDSKVKAALKTLRYITHQGDMWTVADIDESNHPRVVITLGGIYNGDERGISR